MSLQTSAVRNAIYDILVTVTGFSASNVFKGRYTGNSVPEASLPQAYIYHTESEAEPTSLGNSSTTVNSNFGITVYAGDTSSAITDELLDTHVDNIRESLKADRKLGLPEIFDSYVSGFSYDLSELGAIRVGTADIQFFVSYNTN